MEISGQQSPAEVGWYGTTKTFEAYSVMIYRLNCVHRFQQKNCKESSWKDHHQHLKIRSSSHRWTGLCHQQVPPEHSNLGSNSWAVSTETWKKHWKICWRCWWSLNIYSGVFRICNYYGIFAYICSISTGALFFCCIWSYQFFYGLAHVPGKQYSPLPVWGTGFSDSAHREVHEDPKQEISICGVICFLMSYWGWYYFTILQISRILVLPVSDSKCIKILLKDSCKSSHTWQLRGCAFEPKKICRC